MNDFAIAIHKQKKTMYWTKEQANFWTEKDLDVIGTASALQEKKVLLAQTDFLKAEITRLKSSDEQGYVVRNLWVEVYEEQIKKVSEQILFLDTMIRISDARYTNELLFRDREV